MQLVVGVRFKKAGKIYYFGPNGIDLTEEDHVIVETARGVEYGDVVIPPKMVPDEDIVPPLKCVIRKADAEDDQRVIDNKAKEQEAFSVCEQKILAHNLPMKLIDVELTFDNSKLIFYFTADGRIDFRELVKDLAAVFKTRIELRQIGVRDEAKMLGGLGPCGLTLCCSTFLGDFHPVSIKMAKEQDLSLNPTKISGLCGRLMCCLKYEEDFYEDARRQMPRIGKEIMTPDGRATVLETNILRQKVKVKMILADDTVDVREFSVSDLDYTPDQSDIDEDIVIDDEIKSLIEE